MSISYIKNAALVPCKTNRTILLFHPFVQDASDSFVPCFAFVLCIMMSAVPFYMDHKPRMQGCQKITTALGIEPSETTLLVQGSKLVAQCSEMVHIDRC